MLLSSINLTNTQGCVSGKKTFSVKVEGAKKHFQKWFPLNAFDAVIINDYFLFLKT